MTMRKMSENAGFKLKEQELEESLNAIELLEQQHREVEDLFEQIEALGERAYKSKEKLFVTIAEKLIMHTYIEEEVFYPAAKSLDKDLILEAHVEHAVAKDLISQLRDGNVNDEDFDAKVTVLKEIIEHHVEEEEKELFPHCKKIMSEEKLKELGAEMQKLIENPNIKRTKKRASLKRA